MVAENSVVVCCVAKKRCRKVRDWRNVLGEGLENGAYQRFEAATSGLEVGKVEVFWRCVATRLETLVFGSWPIEWVSASQDGGGCMVKVEALR